MIKTFEKYGQTAISTSNIINYKGCEVRLNCVLIKRVIPVRQRTTSYKTVFEASDGDESPEFDLSDDDANFTLSRRD